MPFLDVTDNLSDPDFATTFDVFRSATTAGDNGETQLSEPSDPTFPGVIGVVLPANSNDLRRMADAGLERMTGALTIFTTFNLLAGGTLSGVKYTADIIVWKDRQYTVFTVDDWSQFGAGFVRATATMLSLT
ncbi:MAG: hypothetical protein P4M05_28390 [Bradyrhizobium sp.]|nr:hypothetical protein [Bradyrhizobium sp.]